MELDQVLIYMGMIALAWTMWQEFRMQYRLSRKKNPPEST